LVGVSWSALRSAILRTKFLFAPTCFAHFGFCLSVFEPITSGCTSRISKNGGMSEVQTRDKGQERDKRYYGLETIGVQRKSSTVSVPNSSGAFEAIMSGVNYFFRSTTTILPDRRQLQALR
jgi:hypothetical protein